MVVESSTTSIAAMASIPSEKLDLAAVVARALRVLLRIGLARRRRLPVGLRRALLRFGRFLEAHPERRGRRFRGFAGGPAQPSVGGPRLLLHRQPGGGPLGNHRLLQALQLLL